MNKMKLCTAIPAFFIMLLSAGSAFTAGQWGPFAPTSSFHVRNPCNDPRSFLFSSTPLIWGNVRVTTGEIRNSRGRLLSQYEKVYAYNISSLNVPVDLGVLTTNDNFAGMYIPFHYFEHYQVRVGEEREVVTYEGFGINTLASCRVRTS